MRQRASGGSVVLPSSGDVIASSIVLGQKSNRSGLVTRRSKYFLCLLQWDVSVLFPRTSLFVHYDIFYHLSSCLWYIGSYFTMQQNCLKSVRPRLQRARSVAGGRAWLCGRLARSAPLAKLRAT